MGPGLGRRAGVPVDGPAEARPRTRVRGQRERRRGDRHPGTRRRLRPRQPSPPLPRRAPPAHPHRPRLGHLPRRGRRPPRPSRRPPRQGDAALPGRHGGGRRSHPAPRGRRPRPRLLLPRPRLALQARGGALLPDGPAPGRRPVRPPAAARPRRAGARGGPGPSQRLTLRAGAARRTPAPSVPAQEALADRFLPPLPAPFPTEPHPGQPPSYPEFPGARDPLALDQLATDAAARAHALLATGADPIAGLTAWQDAVRLAAARPTAGLTATTRALYRELASATGRNTTDLARAVAAWRQGGPEGLAVLETPWDPPAGPFDRARPALAAAGFPRFQPWRNHLTHPGGALQLRFGHDGRWYGYESDPGADEWWPRAAPDSDPVGALLELSGG